MMLASKRWMDVLFGEPSLWRLFDAWPEGAERPYSSHTGLWREDSAVPPARQQALLQRVAQHVSCFAWTQRAPPAQSTQAWSPSCVNLMPAGWLS